MAATLKPALIKSTLPTIFNFHAERLYVGSHTYHGWFIGGGTEIALSGLFGLPAMPTGLFWRSEYRYSSFNSADLYHQPSCGSGLQVASKT